jgi:hypothetical protein
VANEADGAKTDPFVLDGLYANPLEVFQFKPIPKEDAAKSAVVVLDTNALLVPYGTGKESLSEIRKTYLALAGAGRLIVPGQVAREFAKNRPEKLKTLFQQISRKRNVTAPEACLYPLAESLGSYQHVKTAEKELLEKIGQYRKALDELLDQVKLWQWDDPVSELYREVFTAPVVVGLNHDKEPTCSEWARRLAHKLPPGYKDGGKADAGIGDFLIWLTILQVGRDRQTNVIFVSGDEKSDWWYQSESVSLYPRFELLEEFRKETNGHSLHIVRFGEFLAMFGASAKVVQEVQQEELVVPSPEVASRKFGVPRHEASSAVAAFLSAGGNFSQQSDFPEFLSVDDPGKGVGVVLVHAPDAMRLSKQLHTASARLGRSEIRNLTVIVVALPPDMGWLRRIMRGKQWPFTIIYGCLTPAGDFSVDGVIEAGTDLVYLAP